MSAAESQEELFAQVLALPYLAACKHSPNCPRGCKCYLDERDCECADIDCDACETPDIHAPWECPNFTQERLAGFATEPAVIKLIAPAHGKLIARGFCSTNEVRVDDCYDDEIYIKYDDALGMRYYAELVINLYLKTIQVDYYRDERYGCTVFEKSDRLFASVMAAREKLLADLRELAALRAENADLRAENAQLREQVEYQPGGPGYERARVHFKDIVG